MITSNSHNGNIDVDMPSKTLSSYLTTSQMNSSFSSSALNILSLNIRSLAGKFDILRDYLATTTTKFSIIALQEVWSVERNFSLPDFHQLQSQSRDRGEKIDRNCGGGAAFFINKNFDFEPLPELNFFIKGVYESVWLLLTDKKNKKGQKILVGSIYRPDTAPRADICLALKTHNNILNLISKNKVYRKSKLFICSDFNLDLLQTLTSQNVSDYSSAHSIHGLNSLINISAHITPTSAKVIDHVFSNTPSATCRTGVLLEHFSDHLPLVISDSSFKVSTPQPDPPVRIFSKDNIKAYLTLLKNTSFVIDVENVEGSFNSFFDILTQAAEISFPLKPKKKKVKNKISPWITKGLIKSATTKKEAFHQKD